MSGFAFIVGMLIFGWFVNDGLSDVAEALKRRK